MIAETIADVISETEKFHRQLKVSLQSATDNAPNERVRMLTSYLVEHEDQLIEQMKEFLSLTDDKVLQTYCVEYINHDGPFNIDPSERSYAQMDAEQLLGSVMQEHDELIEFYCHLKARAATPEVTQFAEEILSTLQHETQRIAQAGNRLQDI